jgi:hypothetical protein
MLTGDGPQSARSIQQQKPSVSLRASEEPNGGHVLTVEDDGDQPHEVGDHIEDSLNNHLQELCGFLATIKVLSAADASEFEVAETCEYLEMDNLSNEIYFKVSRADIYTQFPGRKKGSLHTTHL